MRPASLLAAACLCAFVAGCAGTPPAVRLDPPAERALPSKFYPEALRIYTRHAHLINDYDTALDADAILMTDEFRAALVGKIAAMRGLPPADRDHLADDQARDAGNFVECLVMLVTSRWEWNDLANTNSVWTITFHDDAGRSVSAMERSTIPWKVEELTALAPSVSSFTRAWRIRFPRTFSDGTPLLRPDARELSMKFAGPLGQAWFRWSIAAASAAGDAAR